MREVGSDGLAGEPVQHLSFSGNMVEFCIKIILSNTFNFVTAKKLEVRFKNPGSHLIIKIT
jgi:hypothetical protein